LKKKTAEQALPGSELGGGGAERGELAQTVCTRMNKYKNNKKEIKN
jgi:hypothetical protein